MSVWCLLSDAVLVLARLAACAVLCRAVLAAAAATNTYHLHMPSDPTIWMRLTRIIIRAANIGSRRLDHICCNRIDLTRAHSHRLPLLLLLPTTTTSTTATTSILLAYRSQTATTAAAATATETALPFTTTTTTTARTHYT